MMASADRTPAAPGARRETSSATLVERFAVTTFGVLRTGTVAQLVASMVMGGPEAMSATPLTSWIVTATIVAWSIGFFVAVIRHGSFAALPKWWGIADIAIAVSALIVVSTALPSDWEIGTWHATGYYYAAIVSATTPAWLRSRIEPLLVAAGFSIVYVSLMLTDNTGLAATVAINAVAFLVYTGAGAVILPTVRRLAHDSDANADRAVRLAAELERTRYQFHIHNATGLLAQLARDDTPATLVPSLRAQALAESNRLRREALTPPGENTADQETTTTLEHVVLSATTGFGHLPLEIRTAIGRDIHLTSFDAMILRSALISLLYNVQFHAHATEVVVHTDSLDGRWEVSVCDDGTGFDPDHTPYGFGLQSQVLDSAHQAGMTVHITSHPGEGTCVFISGNTHAIEDGRAG